MRDLPRFLCSIAALALLATGCAPLSFVNADQGAGVGGGAGIGGNSAYGGGASASDSSGTISSGSGGQAALPEPHNGSFSYLCGGSNAACSPDPGSEDCTPGGNPVMGGSPVDALKFTCHLIESAGAVQAKCGDAGELGDTDPCDPTVGANCQSGFVCTAATIGGICRQSCCAALESCPGSNFCSPVALASGTQLVPVCVPVQSCSLLHDETCLAGQTCAIVRTDGTTSCVEPGLGHEGEPCSCAAGFTCSKITNTCRKLCDTTSSSITQCGAGGSCQGGMAPYPNGVGVCAPH